MDCLYIVKLLYEMDFFLETKQGTRMSTPVPPLVWCSLGSTILKFEVKHLDTVPVIHLLVGCKGLNEIWDMNLQL